MISEFQYELYTALWLPGRLKHLSAAETMLHSGADFGWAHLFLLLWTDQQVCGCRAPVSLDRNWDTKHIQIFPNVAGMRCICAFACRKFTDYQKTSAQVWLLLTWILRERTKTETGRHLLLTRSAKIHNSAGRGTEEQREAVWRDRGSAMLTWSNLAMRDPSDHTPSICSWLTLLDKNNCLHSSLDRIICVVWKDLI